MRKTFSVLCAFCLGLMISVSIIACADSLETTDPTDNSSSDSSSTEAIIDPIVNSISCHYGGSDAASYSIYYDKDGMISSLRYSEGNFVTNYNVSISESRINISVSEGQSITISGKNFDKRAAHHINHIITDAISLVF